MSTANLLVDDLVDQLYQALLTALTGGKYKGEALVRSQPRGRVALEFDKAGQGQAKWSRGRCEFAVSVDGLRWVGSLGYQVRKDRGNSVKPLGAWIWPDSPSTIRGTAFEFAAHPGSWTRLRNMDDDFTSSSLIGLQGAIRANVGAKSVSLWAPSILHVMKQLHTFVSDESLDALTIHPVDQEFPILLERGDGWAGMLVTKTDGRHPLRTGRRLFEGAVARAIADLSVMTSVRAPEILARPGLAWLRSYYPASRT